MSTALDTASLADSLVCWERAEYVFASLVAFACAGEYIASFTNWFTDGIEERKKRLERRSTLLLIAALAFELVCLVRTNSLSGQLIGSLRDVAVAADTKAQSAIEKSSTAENKASEAITASGKADAAAKGATEGSRNATVLASRARYLASDAEDTANSAKNDVKLAQDQLVNLKMGIANASQKLAKLEEQIEEVKRRQDPRGVPIDKLVAELAKLPKIPLIIEYQKGSNETRGFAGTLWQAFSSKALWDVPEPMPIDDVSKYDSFTLSDVVVFSRDPSKGMPLVEAMRRAFDGLFVNIGISKDETLPEGVVEIRVGPRM